MDFERGSSSENGKTLTKFNAGIAKLERIDKLKRVSHEARFLRDFNMWVDSLKALRSEISAELKQSEKDDIKKLEIKIGNMLHSIAVNNNGTTKKTIRMVYDLIDSYSDELERLEKITGLGMPDKGREDEATEY